MPENFKLIEEHVFSMRALSWIVIYCYLFDCAYIACLETSAPKNFGVCALSDLLVKFIGLFDRRVDYTNHILSSHGQERVFG